jgi:hypothetical protein
MTIKDVALAVVAMAAFLSAAIVLVAPISGNF